MDFGDGVIAEFIVAERFEDPLGVEGLSVFPDRALRPPPHFAGASSAPDSTSLQGAGDGLFAPE